MIQYHLDELDILIAINTVGTVGWGPPCGLNSTLEALSGSVQSLSHVQLCPPRTAARQASLSITNCGPQHARPPCPSPTPGVYPNTCPSVMPYNHLILCHPLLFPTSIFPSIRVFSNESALHITWPKYWSFSIHPSNEHSGLISFRMDWLNLLVVQGTLKSLF